MTVAAPILRQTLTSQRQRCHRQKDALPGFSALNATLQIGLHVGRKRSSILRLQPWNTFIQMVSDNVTMGIDQVIGFLKSRIRKIIRKGGESHVETARRRKLVCHPGPARSSKP